MTEFNMFAHQLRLEMGNCGVTQAELSKRTGIGRPSISQYLSGKNEPTDARKRQIAKALGLSPDYFIMATTEAPEKPVYGVRRITVKEAARLMHMHHTTLENGLKQGLFPWGYAIKGTGTKYTYYINAEKFAAAEGLQL